MNIIYSDQDIEHLLNLGERSLFLAGPTPRNLSVPSWRPDAIKILEEIDYQGQILVPERLVKAEHIDYDEQVEWEHYGLEHCTRIAFWVPRKLVCMLALTTNVEFGRYVASGRALYGRPDDAEKCRYLDWLYKKYNWQPVYNNLRDLLTNAI